MKHGKKIWWVLSLLVCAVVSNPVLAMAAQESDTGDQLGAGMSLAYCIPFAGMLLCIAICPLVIGDLWDKYKWVAVIFWSLAFLIPFAVNFGVGQTWKELLEVVFGDYITFIVLLFGLFCVAGNICLKGDMAGSPRLNALLILIGGLLASWIGTTGASMLMIRPLLRANAWRKRKAQIVIFFIFIVSNIGGCLTPVGDPPLLMGFTRGVDFFWSLELLPIMLLNFILLLTIFLFVDIRSYKKDLYDGLKPALGDEKKPLRLEGAHNIIFLVMIVGAVILSGVLGDIGAIPLYDGVEFPFTSLIEVAIILLAAFLSYKTTKKEVREANNFSWDAISEVAVLFIGIFITMVPALMILKAKGADLGLTHPWHFFWITGALSSFLDNTPTYLVFFTTAGASHLVAKGSIIQILGGSGTIPQVILMAISAGAVFMGAITYIGNAPNFMVRSIAEENGIKMPSFFGYMVWSLSCLIPVFLIDTLIFFLG